jgi:hypothetical protein
MVPSARRGTFEEITREVPPRSETSLVNILKPFPVGVSKLDEVGIFVRCQPCGHCKGKASAITHRQSQQVPPPLSAL